MFKCSSDTAERADLGESIFAMRGCLSFCLRKKKCKLLSQVRHPSLHVSNGELLRWRLWPPRNQRRLRFPQGSWRWRVRFNGSLHFDRLRRGRCWRLGPLAGNHGVLQPLSQVSRSIPRSNGTFVRLSRLFFLGPKGPLLSPSDASRHVRCRWSWLWPRLREDLLQLGIEETRCPGVLIPSRSRSSRSSRSSRRL